MQLVAFRNDDGELGFIQKEDDHIIYFVNTKAALYTISGEGNWQTWIWQVEAGNYVNGDKKVISKDSIKYFLYNHAETISTNIIEMANVQYPGSYYPRIYRENIFFNYVNEQFLQDVRAYQNIQSSLDILFNYIEPSEKNLSAYGHKIRELLILACTEVECLLVKTLTENGYKKKKRYDTNDYVNCKDVLGLDKFEVMLIQYPNLKVFKPFHGWNSANSTQSLPWYNAYNAVKHDRSGNITNANLEHLLDAISAIHILLESQYSKNIFDRWNSLTEDRSIYKTVLRPTWSCSEVFAPILIARRTGKWSDQREYFLDFQV